MARRSTCQQPIRRRSAAANRPVVEPPAVAFFASRHGSYCHSLRSARRSPAHRTHRLTCISSNSPSEKIPISINELTRSMHCSAHSDFRAPSLQCPEAKDTQILIAPRILAKVEPHIDVEALGEFTLKGFHRAIPAYNVLKLSREGLNRSVIPTVDGTQLGATPPGLTTLTS
jgi:hypothetical protein